MFAPGELPSEYRITVRLGIFVTFSVHFGSVVTFNRRLVHSSVRPFTFNLFLVPHQVSTNQNFLRLPLTDDSTLSEIAPARAPYLAAVAFLHQQPALVRGRTCFQVSN